MKTSKRALYLILSLIMVLNFHSCAPSDDTINNTDSASTTTAIQTVDSINSQAAETIHATQTTPKPPETANAPDPDFYFNSAPDRTVSEYRVYCFKGDPTEAAKNYVSVLQNKYSMTLVNSEEDGTTLVWRLQKGSNENADVDISVDPAGGSDWELWISFGTDVKLIAAETWDEPIVPIISGPTIPSPDAFFDYKLARNEDFYNEKKDKYTLSFCADIDAGAPAMEEYVSLLFDEKYDLELAVEKEKTILYIQNHNYGFNYTGDEDVESVYDDYREIEADLLVYVQRNGQTETALLTLYFKPDVFEFIDFGDRTTYSPIDCSGKNTDPNTPGNNGIYDSDQECSFCDGTGDCSTCGGDGYLMSSASDKEDRNCYKCHAASGNCSYCNGTGRRR